MDILYKSILAGCVTALILLLSRYVGPRLAGAIGGLPVVFAIAYMIISIENKKGDNNFLSGGIYGAIASIFFSILLIVLNNVFDKTYILNFVIAYFTCFILLLVLVNLSSSNNNV